MKGILLGLAVLLLAPSLPAQPPEPAPIDANGTEALRGLLNQREIAPLSDPQWLQEHPRQTLVIVLGAPQILKRHETAFYQYLRLGGNLLLATDRQLPPRDLPFWWQAVVDVGVDGRFYQSSVPEDCFQELPAFPFLELATPRGRRLPRATTELFERLQALTGFVGPQTRIATNKPSILRIGPGSGLGPFAKLPASSHPDKWQPLNQARPFAVAGRWEQAKVMMLADHSLFINAMLLEPTIQNFEFTQTVLDWFNRSESDPIQYCLFVDNDKIRTDFNIRLESIPPIPLNILLNAAAQQGNQVIAALQQEDRLRQWTLRRTPLWKWLRNFVVVLGVLALVIGIRRLIRSRERFDWILPRQTAAEVPVRPVHNTRVQAFMDQEHLTEAARRQVQQWFREHGADLAADRPPTWTIEGTWWARRRLRKQLEHYWQFACACDHPPLEVSSRDWERMRTTLQALDRAALQGHWRFPTSDEVRA